MNLYEQQASNRRRTILVMATFVAFVLVVGLGVDAAVVSSAGTFLPIGTAVALLYGAGSAGYGYLHGDRMVLASTGAVPLHEAMSGAGPGDPSLPLRQFQNVVDEMAIAAGLPPPAAYVVPDADPNAFATGRDPSRASIAVTDGLLRRLTRDELQGVVAHEMAHIRNYDMRLMTVVAALVGAVALLSDWAARGMRHGALSGRRSGHDRNGGGTATTVALFAVWVVAVLFAPIVARLLAMLVSRRREYLADATAAELTRHPLALASALQKIEAEAAPTRAVKRGRAHLCIADPLGRRVNLRAGRLADLFASHPPMAERIAALRGMAYADAAPPV